MQLTYVRCYGKSQKSQKDKSVPRKTRLKISKELDRIEIKIRSLLQILSRFLDIFNQAKKRKVRRLLERGILALGLVLIGFGLAAIFLF